VNDKKFTMKTGSLVRLASNLTSHSFLTEGSQPWDDQDWVHVENLDLGLVVDDLIEEEEEHHVLVLFNEKIVRADCRILRRVK